MNTDFDRRVERMRKRRVKNAPERTSQARAPEGPAVETQLAGNQEAQKGKEKNFNELRAEAREAGIPGYGKMTKQELVEALESLGKL